MGLGHRFWSRGHHGPTLPKALHDLRVGDTQPTSERARSSGQRREPGCSGGAGGQPGAFSRVLLHPSCWWLAIGPAPLGRGLQPPLPPPTPATNFHLPSALLLSRAVPGGRAAWEDRGVSRSCAGWEQLSASGREPLLHFLWMSPLMGSRGWCLPGTLGMLTRHPCSEHPRSTCLFSPK